MGKADGIVRCSKTCFNKKPPVQYRALMPSLVIIKLMTIDYDVEIGSQVEKVQNWMINKCQSQDLRKHRNLCRKCIWIMSVSKVPYTFTEKCAFPNLAVLPFFVTKQLAKCSISFRRFNATQKHLGRKDKKHVALKNLIQCHTENLR